MNKKFFLSKTVDALSEKQAKDLDQVFGGLKPSQPYIPTGGGGLRCPDGFYWHTGVQACIKNGTYPAAPATRSDG
jgi:hypothetical protein